MCLCGTSLAADDVQLHHGKQYRNVRTEISRDFITIRFRNGGRLVVPKQSVKTLVNKPFNWRPVKKKTPRVAAVKPRVAAADTRPKPAPPAKVQPRKSPEPIKKEADDFNHCAFKSLVLPGWGQYSCGSPWAGHGTIASLLLGASYMAALQGSHAALSDEMGVVYITGMSLPRRTFLFTAGLWTYARTLELNAARRRAHVEYRSFSIGMGLLYILQIAHAYMLYEAPSAKERPSGETRISLDVFRGDTRFSNDGKTNRGFRAAVRMRF